jgi:hypothetical protein
MKKIIKYYFLLIINTYSTDESFKEPTCEFFEELQLQIPCFLYDDDIQEQNTPIEEENNEIEKEPPHKYKQDLLNEDNIFKEYKKELVSFYNNLHGKNIDVKNLDDNRFNSLIENLKEEYYSIKKLIKKNCSTENLTKKQIDFIYSLYTFKYKIENINNRDKNTATHPFTKIMLMFKNIYYEWLTIKLYQEIEEIYRSRNMTLKNAIQILERIAEKEKLKETLTLNESKFFNEFKKFGEENKDRIKKYRIHNLEKNFNKIFNKDSDKIKEEPKLQYKNTYFNYKNYTEEIIAEKDREKFVILYNDFYDKNIDIKNLDDDRFNDLIENLQKSYSYIVVEMQKNCSIENLTPQAVNFIYELYNYYKFLINMIDREKKIINNKNPLLQILKICQNNFMSKFLGINNIYQIMHLYNRTEEIYKNKNMTLTNAIEIFQRIAEKKKSKETLTSDENKFFNEYKIFEINHTTLINKRYKANKHILQKKFEEIKLIL